MSKLVRISFPIIVTIMLLFVGIEKVIANNESIRFAEKVNLALRRTAHHLLAINGDSTSTIPPVKQQDANTFIIRVDHLFDYDKLPVFLQQSLDIQGVHRTYNVSILECENGELRLGYNFMDLKQKEGIPCGGRTQQPGCYDLKVSFDPEKQVASTVTNWWVLPFGSIVALLGFMVWRRSRKDHTSEIPVLIEPNTDQKLQFGKSELDMSNLLLICPGTTYNLTYREAKLLRLFVTNTNQILERDFILKSVWEDEGIIVGRSVDVFVSRLRKMLTADSFVKITAVHGVGYRMEVLS